jgi:hypothetical protein
MHREPSRTTSFCIPRVGLSPAPWSVGDEGRQRAHVVIPPQASLLAQAGSVTPSSRCMGVFASPCSSDANQFDNLVARSVRRTCITPGSFLQASSAGAPQAGLRKEQSPARRRSKPGLTEGSEGVHSRPRSTPSDPVTYTSAPIRTTSSDPHPHPSRVPGAASRSRRWPRTSVRSPLAA